MIKLEILDYNGNVVKQWDWNDNMPIPNRGDTVLISENDDPEDLYRATVLRREFNGHITDTVRIVTNYAKMTNEFNFYEYEKTLP